MKTPRARRRQSAERVRALAAPDRTWQRLLTLLAALTAAALLTGCVVVAESEPLPAEAERTIESTVTPATGERIRVTNLAGRVSVRTADGAEARVVATVHAGGEETPEAEELAGTVALVLEQGDGVSSFELRYPVDRATTFHYPQDGGGVAFFGYGFSRSQLDYQGERVTVVSRRRAGALSLWVDLEIRVPAGTEIEIVNAAGDIEAEGVSSDMIVEAQSGDVEISGGTGGARVATGSGDVRVAGRSAAVAISTGSGDVGVRDVAGDVDVRTGSGDVALADVRGSIRARTGSGDIELARVAGAADLGTGSGDVEGTEVDLRDMLVAHTGSGSIELSGSAAGLTGADLETGSGDIDLELAELPAASLRIHTSSGDIDTDVGELQILRQDDEVLEAYIGEEPRAEIRVETSSGSVTIRSRR